MTLEPLRHGFVKSVNILVFGWEKGAAHVGADEVAEVWR